MTPGFFKALFTTADERLDEAVDLFNRAAEIYKVKREYDKDTKNIIIDVRSNTGGSTCYSNYLF